MSPETRRSTQGLDAGPAIQPSPGRAPTAAAAAANTIATVSAAIQASAPVAGSANGGTTAPSSSGSGSRKPTVKRAINPMRKAIKKHLHKSSLPNEKGGGSPTSPDGDPSYPVTVPADGSAGSGPSHARTIAPSTSKAEHTAIDVIIQRLLDIGMSSRIPKTLPLKSSEILSLLQQVQTVLLSQPMLLELNAPIKIVGDIHGQFFDLMRIFTKSGWPPNSNYLFLGDYVDRGKQSLETILLLFAFKIRYKENFFLLRGNHECASISRVYGFYDECKRRASVKVWKNFVNTFNCLPIAAVVADKIFCVHGGLSPSLSTMDDIRVIPRPTDVPDFGLINDILWSDPSHTAVEWEDNDRGVSYCFGKQILNQFLQRHDFDLLARAHMVVEDGYEFFAGRSLVTIFSAPNYCEIFSNSGAVMIVERDLVCRFDLLQPTSQPSVTLQDEVVKADAAAAAAAGIEVDTAQAANGPMNKEGIGRHNDTIRKASREAAKILSSLPTKSSNSSNANAIVTNLPSSASAAPPNARWNPNTSSSLESALAASLHNQAESPSKMLSAGRKSSHKSPVPAPLSRLGG